MKTTILLACLALFSSGCSQRAWYDGFRDGQRQECYRLPGGELRECLERLERAGYDRYRRERERLDETD